MSYSDLLWDNSEVVIRQANFQRALFQDFMAAIRLRIQAQQNYSTELRNLSMTLDRTLNKQCPDRNYIIFAMSAFKSDVVRRETQTNTFVNHLKQQVLIKREAKSLEKQIAIIDSGFIEIRKKMDIAKIKLSQLDKARQQQFMKLEIAKIRLSTGRQDKQKQIAKAASVEKQYKDYDVTYRSIMKEYNTYIQEYLDSIEHYLKILQTQEEERTNKMLDNIKKIMVFESAMMRNFEYDIINIINQLNDLEKGKDIQQFMQKYTKGNKKPKQENVPKLNMRSTVIYEMLIRKLDDKIQMETVEIRKLVGQNKNKEKEINGNGKLKDKEGIIQNIKNQQHELVKVFVNSGNKIESNVPTDAKFKQIFDKDDNRNFAQLYIRHKIQAANYETDQTNRTLIRFLLEKCIQKRDIFCIRRVLNLAFTQLSIKTPKQKQKLIYGQIINLPLWQSHDFWEASIFQSVQQKLKSSKGQKGESKQDAKARQKIAILNQLADHCNMMVMLGYNIKSIKLLASKFLKLYELGQEESRHLLNILYQSTDVYNQISINSSQKSGQTQGSQKNQSTQEIK